MNKSRKAVEDFLNNRLFAEYQHDLDEFRTLVSGLISDCKDDARSKLIKLALKDVDWGYLHQCQAKRAEEEEASGDYLVPF